MNSMNQGPAIIQPSASYAYEYSYSYSQESTRAKKNVSPSDENSQSSSCPLDLLSSAASAVIDDESSSLASSSSQTHRIRSSTPPQPPIIEARRPPIAYAIPPSPSTAFAVASSPPTLLPRAAVRQHPQIMTATFPHSSHGRHSFPMPPGVEIAISQRPSITPTFPHETRSDWNIPRAQRASAFVPKAAKRQQTPKYKMKFQYVSMKRSDAVKYLEALSSGYHPGNYAVQNSLRPIPTSPLSSGRYNATTVPTYRLPVATAVVPNY
mmetsp:Transcript_20055/g.49909  ORF Transcript_20055/g.49909 Transcript_20055/m.49909 type:complete len:266 (-) Transcript_20055:131-928(-)